MKGALRTASAAAILASSIGMAPSVVAGADLR
jgi:hypothetical protein